VPRVSAASPILSEVHSLVALLPLPALDTLTGRLARSRVGAVTLPLNLWDIATVVARRPEK